MGSTPDQVSEIIQHINHEEFRIGNCFFPYYRVINLEEGVWVCLKNSFD
jgi:hypothetical protein